MLAIDTNVVVRFLVNDEPRQAASAKALIEQQRVLVTATVMMETEWVLRGAYGQDRRRVVRALHAFARLPNVELDDGERIVQALDWAEAGLDFADALHLAASVTTEAFVTFDRHLVRRAGKLGAVSVREP